MEVDNLLTLVILFFSKSVMLKIYTFRPDAIIGVFPSYCLTIISKSKNPKMNPCILFPVNFISNDELCFFPDTQTEGLRIVLGFFLFFSVFISYFFVWNDSLVHLSCLVLRSTLPPLEPPFVSLHSKLSPWSLWLSLYSIPVDSCSVKYSWTVLSRNI